MFSVSLKSTYNKGSAMKGFPEAKEVVAKYEIQGREGLWVRQKYEDARTNPAAIKAYKKKRLIWFAPESKVQCENRDKCNDYSVIGNIACKCCNGDYETRNKTAELEENYAYEDLTELGG